MLISVVIPSYNHRQYVVQAIESVLDQDWPEIDLIVIDDGSTDGSPEVIESLKADRGGFRFVSRENRGLIRTLNQGLEMARGDAFCLLASDDYLLAESIRKRAEALLESPDYVGVFADCLQITGEGPEGKTVINEKRRRLFEVDDPVPEFLKGVNLPIHSMMVRREVILANGGFDPRYQYCEDLDVQLLLFLAGPVGFIDAPVYCYRTHETNISVVNRHLARADKVLCFRKYLHEIPKLSPYRSLIRCRLRRHYLALGRYLNKAPRPTRREKELFEGGWEFAWQDMRLLWHLVQWKFARRG